MQPRHNLAGKILLMSFVGEDFTGQEQGHFGLSGRVKCEMETFLRADPAQGKRESPLRISSAAQGRDRDAIFDDGHVGGAWWAGAALGRGNTLQKNVRLGVLKH